MPSLCAASITVLPPGTCTAWPSTSRLSVVMASDVIRNETALVIDVVLELGAEVLDEALYRQCGGVAQGADGAPGDVVRHRQQHVQVLVLALAVLDPGDDAPQPAGALAAWRALSAGLLKIEIGQPEQRAHHAA